MNLIDVGYDSTNYVVLEQTMAGQTTRLLIDVGMPGTLPKFQAVLKRKGLSLPSIHYLLVTHYHPDHAGIAQEVKAQGVRLIVAEPQLAAIPQLQQYVKANGPFVPITLDNTVQVSMGESRALLKQLGFDGEIVHTPGHSDDSVSLVLDTGLAFTGDLGDAYGTADTSDDLTRQSWAKLRALHVTQIYPGHGPMRPFGPRP